MDNTAMLEQLTATFRAVLDEPELALSASTTAADVDGWDSLMHVQLVVAVERAFGIRFGAREIQGWQRIGDMMDSIRQRLG